MRKNSWIVLINLGLTLWFSGQGPGYAWDDNWTQAKSGRGDLFDDPGRSDGQAGTDPPQKFWIPGPRDHADVDPEELHDYFDRKNKDYTPYALARIEQTIQYKALTIPKGYYLIKPGDPNDGSPKMTVARVSQQPMPLRPTQTDIEDEPPQLPPLETEVDVTLKVSSTDPLPPCYPQPVCQPQSVTVKVTTTSPESSDSNEPVSSVSSPAAAPVKPKAAVYQTLVIIRQGEVMGVVPVHRMLQYRAPKDQKVPRRALAWVEWRERRPVLRFYYKKWVYETEFQ